MRSLAIHALFFLSGISGLVYQVVWVRQFGNLFGNSVHSAAAVSGVFLCGLGLGSWLGGRWIDRRWRSDAGCALRAYGKFELGIAALGLGIAARYVGLLLPRVARSWVPLAFTVGIIMSFRVVLGFGGSGFGFSVTELVILAAAISVAALLREQRAIAWIVVLAITVHIPIAEGGGGLDDWGGLQLSLLLAVAGIVLAFPIGILLALGRRSSLAGLRTVSIGFIEFIRGVPLITLLLSANFFLGFFLPVGSETPSLVGRAIVVITLFSGAYIAEIISVRHRWVHAAANRSVCPTTQLVMNPP